MTAEAVGRHMPAVVTLDDPATMNHRRPVRPPEQVLQGIPGPAGDGGRIPDLAVWSRLTAHGMNDVVAELPLAWSLTTEPAIGADLRSLTYA